MAQTQQTVPQTQWDKELESLNREAELVQEQIGLMNRLREIDLERQGFQAPVQQAAVEPRTVKAATPAQPQAKAPTPAGSGDGKTADLPTLLETISQQVNKPLKHMDFVTLVREAGYTTKAKDFSNMVYQALLKLVKRGTLKKNAETREYACAGEKAA
jgi:hypothetical protein